MEDQTGGERITLRLILRKWCSWYDHIECQCPASRFYYQWGR